MYIMGAKFVLNSSKFELSRPYNLYEIIHKRSIFYIRKHSKISRKSVSAENSKGHFRQFLAPLWHKKKMLFCQRQKRKSEMIVQRVPALRVFWDLKKTVLHETRVSGTVLWSPTNANSPTYTYISQKTC